MAEELTFRLEDFEGPLELLLTLVQKHKMDLHNIPILELIDQYTSAVESAESTDPEISSAFIEMAAHLVEMKSYLLLPRSEEGGKRNIPCLCAPRPGWNGTTPMISSMRRRCWQTAGRP